MLQGCTCRERARLGIGAWAASARNGDCRYDELKPLAASKNVKLPDGPSVKQKAEIKLIDAGDNDKFDARYAKHFGVDAHRETLKLFEDAAKNAKDPEVRAWAERTPPPSGDGPGAERCAEEVIAPAATSLAPCNLRLKPRFVEGVT